MYIFFFLAIIFLLLMSFFDKISLSYIFLQIFSVIDAEKKKR